MSWVQRIKSLLQTTYREEAGLGQAKLALDKEPGVHGFGSVVAAQRFKTGDAFSPASHSSTTKKEEYSSFSRGECLNPCLLVQRQMGADGSLHSETQAAALPVYRLIRDD